MELSGVCDLGYFGWAKATDHTQNCEFFSIYHGRIIFFSRLDTHPYFERFFIGAQRQESFEVLDL